MIPAVHIRDNLDLQPNGYRLSLLGVTVGEADVFPDRELAINPGEVFGDIPGQKTIDPVFGLEAVWIDPLERDTAETHGFTVVDASTVIATHLSQILQQHANELLGHEEVQQLLDKLSLTSPKLVEDLVPKVLSLGVVVKTLQNLLQEGVPIRDIRSIIESLAEHAPKSQDPDTLTAAVRTSLGRFIVQHLNGMGEILPVITLEPSLDQILHQTVQASEEGAMGLEPGLAERIYQGLAETAKRQELANEPAIALVADRLRPLIARMARHAAPTLRVLAFGEVPDNKQIKIVATIGRSETLENED